MKRACRVAVCAAALAIAASGCAAGRAPVRVGSKKFTESVLLSEIALGVLSDRGVNAVHRRELGGTRILWSALLRGEIDVYPEYTGTLRGEILARERVGSSDAALRATLARHGVVMGAPLGFSDTYALGMRETRARELGIRRISDLATHPELRFAFSSEFMDRAEGWGSVRRAYGLSQRDVRGLDHELAYRGLAAGAIDVTDLYSTDAEIVRYRIRVLEDDRGHFPRYDAVLLWRADLASRWPNAVAALRRMEDVLDAREMTVLNARVNVEGRSETSVAADFARSKLGVVREVSEDDLLTRLGRRTLEHLELVVASLLLSLVFALPLGIVAGRRRRLGQAILGVTGVLQTIPSIALLVLLIPVLGIGALPAMAALFVYGLLPIVRNTATGLTDIPRPMRESAEALGLPSMARLRLVELPLAARAILAGVKTSAVLGVGNATLGALVGAGGYGQPILSGIRLDDTGLILEGALPAAALALLAQGLFELLERWVVPRGLTR